MTQLIPVDFNPFEEDDVIDSMPATESQQEIFMSCLIGGLPANLAYNESISLVLSGPLNKVALIEALERFVSRHDILKAYFSSDGELMLLHKETFFNIQEIDLSVESSLAAEKKLNDIKKAEVNTAFDLEKGPLFRIILIKQSVDKYILIFSVHHIIFDGWSFGVLLYELGNIYSSLIDQKEPHSNLPPPSSFVMYAKKQRLLFQSQEYKKTEDYWLKELTPPLPVMDLPTDFLRPSIKKYEANRYDYSLDTTLVESLKKTGAASKTSFVNTVFAAFEIFISQLSKKKDIIIGTPTSGQSYSEMFNLIGYCVNLIPVRSKIDYSLSFAQYLNQRRSKFLDDFENQNITFGSLLKKISIPRDPSRVTLVPIIFNIDLGMNHKVGFSGLTYELEQTPRDFENFELFLNVFEFNNKITLEWSYKTSLFKESTIIGWTLEFENLLKKLVQQYEQPIAELFETTPAEEMAMEAAVDHTPHFLDFFDRAVASFPTNVAVVHMDESITYKQLNIHAENLAHFLRQKGLVNGDRVCVVLERSVNVILAFIAIQKAGGVYIPIDPDYPVDRVDYMLKDSNARMAICSSSTSKLFRYTSEKINIEEVIGNTTKSSEATDSPNFHRYPNASAYIIYTSGSTGKPKGVEIAHKGLYNFINSVRKAPGILPTDVWACVASVSFDMSVLDIYLPLSAGATLLLTDRDTTKDGDLLLQQLKKRKVTIMQATPSTWSIMLDSGWESSYPKIKVLAGGEALTKNIATRLHPFSTAIWNLYGPTETTVYSTIKKIVPEEDIITVGQKIDNTQIYIVDEQLNPLPDGSIGEIVIGGDGVAKGYINKPQLTKEKFITNHFEAKKEKSVYRTGDLGTILPNGELQCLGRIDNQVKIRGFRIELGEIEQCLIQEKNEVSEAVAVVKEFSEDDKRIYLFITIKKSFKGQAVDLTEYTPNHSTFGEPPASSFSVLQLQAAFKQSCKDSLQKKLPNYMVPVDIIGVDELPLSESKKTDKKKLLNILSQNQTVEQQNQLDRIPTKTEELVLKLWKELLSTNEISLNSNFFEIGGHSLIAVKLVSLLKKETGKSLPITTLFENPTIEKLAQLIDSKDDVIDLWSSYVPIKSTGTKPPIYIVHGAGLSVMVFNSLAQELDKEQPVIGLQAKGLNGMDTPLYSIEEIAAHYINEITKHNPNGPYALAGYSFGGLIVYEMVKQLKASGKGVFLVGMLDSAVSESDFHKPFSTRLYNRISTFFKKVGYTLKLSLKDPVFIIGFRYRSLKKNIRSLLERLNIVKKSNDNKNVWIYTKNAFEAINIAYDNYKPTPHFCTIDLFKCGNQPYYLPDTKFLGWKPYALENLNIHDIPGDHSTIFEYPDVKGVAAKLQEVLNNSYQNYRKAENKVQ